MIKNTIKPAIYYLHTTYLHVIHIKANTEVIAGEGLIVTAGAIDCHVHYICPDLVYEAISSGEFYN